MSTKDRGYELCPRCGHRARYHRDGGITESRCCAECNLDWAGVRDLIANPPSRLDPAPALLVRVDPVHAAMVLPAYQTGGAAGLDLALSEDLTVWSGGAVAMGRTALSIELPPHHVGLIFIRSGIAKKHCLAIMSSGVIDEDYRGEIGIPLVTHGSKSVHLQAGTRVAQLLVMPVTRVRVVEALDLSATARGAGGFGSTGGDRVETLGQGEYFAERKPAATDVPVAPLTPLEESIRELFLRPPSEEDMARLQRQIDAMPPEERAIVAPLLPDSIDIAKSPPILIKADAAEALADLNREHFARMDRLVDTESAARSYVETIPLKRERDPHAD